MQTNQVFSLAPTDLPCLPLDEFTNMRYAIVAFTPSHAYTNTLSACNHLNLRTTPFVLPLESSGASANNPRYNDPTKSSLSALISSVVLLAVIGTDP